MNVKDVAENYRLFVDTCSLMDENADNFFYKLAPILLDLNKKIIIPHKVAIEIENLRKSPKPNYRTAAHKGSVILKEYVDHDLIHIRGEKGDSFSDNVFKSVFSKFRTRYNLALITQNEELARGIIGLNNAPSVQSSKKILVLKLGKTGGLSIWRKKQDPPESTPDIKRDTSTTAPNLLKFRLCTTARPKTNNILKVHKLPNEGDHVNAGSFGPVRLDRVLGEGGEGKVFLTNSGHACKIYFKHRITENVFNKLALMTERKIEIPGVCWPRCMVHNPHGDFAGYLMPLAKGRPMQKCMFVKPLLNKHFPNWTRRNLVQLAITWLEKIIELHKLNILIGDVNPLNFSIKSDTEVYFVDTDSYQIEDFPCPVHMVNFTAPEIQGNDFSSFLRTFENEYFSIATLLFMILLPGKPPYSHQGGGDPAKNIKRGQFPYPFSGKTSAKMPDGPWRFIWSHLPYNTKEAFYNCFANQKRISAEEWLSLMNRYKFALEEGMLDPSGESDKLFPTRFKGVSNYAKNVYGMKDNTWETYSCIKCSKTYQAKKELASRYEKICYDCRKIEKVESTTGEMIICNGCSEAFMFTIKEERLYKQKRYKKPKYCKMCREKRNDYKSTTYSTSRKQPPNPPSPPTPPVPPRSPNKTKKLTFWDIIKRIFR